MSTMNSYFQVLGRYEALRPDRKEEKDMGVKRDKEGAISDITKPLMGTLQENQGVISLPASNPSQAIVDVSENMRAKLYSLFCKIGWSDLAGLSVEDHVTLVVLEKYLDFKMGEVWTEIIQELHVENVRPVTPDMEAIEAISRGIEERAKIVAGTQIELLEAQQNQDLLDEQEFYAEIRENHRQREKAMADFTDYVGRTSNYSLLKAAHKRQELSIEASLMGNRYREQDSFHPIEMKNLRTTTFSGRTVNVHSTPQTLTGGPLAQYDPKTGSLRERKVIKPKASTMSNI